VLKFWYSCFAKLSQLVTFDDKCSYISFIHFLRVLYNFDTCVQYISFYIFFISEWPRSFNFIKALSFLVSFGEVKEAVTQKWYKAVQH
jgi:hypothetical protein